MSNFDEDKTSEIDQHMASRTGGTKRMKSAKWIAIAKICADPTQPRKNFNESSIAELAQSIQNHAEGKQEKMQGKLKQTIKVS